MLQRIKFLLSLGSVSLVNTRGCVLSVSAIAISDIGIYTVDGTFYSRMSLVVLEYKILVK